MVRGAAYGYQHGGPAKRYPAGERDTKKATRLQTVTHHQQNTAQRYRHRNPGGDGYHLLEYQTTQQRGDERCGADHEQGIRNGGVQH